MKNQVHILASVVLVLLLVECSLTYHPDFSWRRPESFMTGDLRLRMNKKIPTRRRYCSCDEVKDEDNYPVCASNKALYTNACLFDCAKMRLPHLTAINIDSCGTYTFKEFNFDSEFRPHY